MSETIQTTYKLITHDCRQDNESATIMCLLKWEGNHPEEPIKWAKEHCADEDVDQFRDEAQADFMRALYKACEDGGVYLKPVTPESSYTPTGRWFWSEPCVYIFKSTVLVLQSGGMDV